MRVQGQHSIKTSAKTFLRYWLPALLWLAAIAMFSSQLFAANHTGSFLRTILAWLHLKLSTVIIFILHYSIRKLAHFTAYGILGALFYRAFRGPVPEVMWRLRWPMLALAVCLATASADEVHQLFTPGRTGSYRDVLLDMMGALFAQLVILVAYLGKAGRKSREARVTPP